jgi:maltose O-acetyltransferase
MMLAARTRRVWTDGRAVLNARWRLRTVEVGSSVRVWGRPVVACEGRLVIGDHVRLVATLTPIEFFVGRSGVLEIGDRTFINYGSSVGAMERVTIGARCNLGSDVIILDNPLHRLEPERRLEVPPSQPVTIEDDVWLGSRVIVLPGVTIGAGSAVGAGSIVTKSVPPRSLAVGVPARVLREL